MSHGSFFSGCHSRVHFPGSGLQKACPLCVAAAAAADNVCNNCDGDAGLHSNHTPVELPLWQPAAAVVCYRKSLLLLLTVRNHYSQQQQQQQQRPLESDKKHGRPEDLLVEHQQVLYRSSCACSCRYAVQ